MTEPKFNIRPFDPSKPSKRIRRIDPPPPVPKNVGDWNALHSIRYNMGRIMELLEMSAGNISTLNDPVVSRAVLRIHRALLRIDARTFQRSVDRPLRDDDSSS